MSDFGPLRTFAIAAQGVIPVMVAFPATVVILAMVAFPATVVIPAQAGIHVGAGWHKPSKVFGFPVSRQAVPGSRVG